jgi:outer membrane receptor protein involved in Fe transport
MKMNFTLPSREGRKCEAFSGRGKAAKPSPSPKRFALRPSLTGRVAFSLAFLLATPALAATPETVVVTASPLPGGTIDPDKMPGEVSSLSVSDLDRDRQQDVLPNLVATELAGVSLNDEQGSQFQPDFVYRGFEASPISGVAEGLAVYQNGVRLNESFGDAMNWDLVPGFAVDRFTLESGNPAFGLNALAGAVALQMKDGFHFAGTQAQLSGGSYGNITGDAQYGAQFGHFGIYAGIGGTDDDGFRDHSMTRLRQAYVDGGYEDGRATLHLALAAANNDIQAVGPTPVELLEQDRRAVFTYPQAIGNQMELAQLHGTYKLDSDFLLSANVYYRHFEQALIDGNTTDVVACANNPVQFCLEGNGDFPGDALFDQNGNPVPVSALPAGATPGEIDHTHTDTQSWGGTLELSSKSDLFGHGNDFVFGASLDHGDTRYSAHGELGALLADLRVAGAGVIIDQSGNPNAQPPLEEPVSVDATNTYAGIYGIDAFDVTDRLTATLSGRVNIADIKLTDLLGNNLNGSHDFSRFDPGAGFTYKVAPATTFYLGYSEANRAPTAGELSCANPASPCLLDAFLVSDPPLKQVVARTYETGLRGAFDPAQFDGHFVWSLGVYRTEVARDILLLATDVNGFGFFQNAGTTRHQGFDASLGYQSDRWRLNLAYSFLDATFRNALVLSSNSPAADANGLIFVAPGDRLPLTPRNRLTFGVDYAPTPQWTVGGDVRYQSSQFLAGDQSNQEAPLPGFTTVDLHGAYRLSGNFELFGEIENALDRRYSTYGTFTELDGLPPNFNLSDPRTYSPAPGRTFFGGVRVSL